MARIPPQTRQEILDKTDYLSIYQEHVRLQRKGASYWGLCPFHSEKTPSFSVSADTVFFIFRLPQGRVGDPIFDGFDKLSYTRSDWKSLRSAQGNGSFRGIRKSW